MAVEVKHLILFHHNPARTDDRLDVIQEAARARLRTQNQPMQWTMAYERLVGDIYKQSVQAGPMVSNVGAQGTTGRVASSVPQSQEKGAT